MNPVYRFVVLVACISVISAKIDKSLITEDLKDLMATLHSTCVDQIGIDEAKIDKLKQGVFEDDKKVKCYIKCVMSESGVMDENGDIDMGVFAELVPEKIRATIQSNFEGCIGHGAGITDYCEKAFKILQCDYDVDPENYIFV